MTQCIPPRLISPMSSSSGSIDRKRTAAGGCRRSCQPRAGRACRSSTLTPHQMLAPPAAKPRPRLKQVRAGGRPLCQHLIRVPVGRIHHAADGLDVVIRHIRLEQVAHRIDEDHLRRPPPQAARPASRAPAAGRSPARTDGRARPGTAPQTSRRSSARSRG